MLKDWDDLTDPAHWRYEELQCGVFQLVFSALFLTNSVPAFCIVFVFVPALFHAFLSCVTKKTPNKEDMEVEVEEAKPKPAATETKNKQNKSGTPLKDSSLEQLMQQVNFIKL